MSLQPQDPFLNLNIHQHNYLPDEEPKVALHGFRSLVLFEHLLGVLERAHDGDTGPTSNGVRIARGMGRT